MSDVEVTDDVVHAPPPPASRPPAKKGGNAPREDISESANQIANADDRSVWEWLTEIGTGSSLQIKLYRKFPRDWHGHPIAGYLEEYDEPFTERDIKLRFGGGKFQVKTWRTNPKGGWMYAGAKTFEIEGDPKISGVSEIPATGKGATDDGDVELQTKAMDHMSKMAEMNQRRAWALEDDRRKNDNRGLDPAMIALVNDPPALRTLQAQLDSLSRQLSEKDRQVLDLITRMNDRPTTPTVVEKTFEHLVAGESSRIDALRAQHDSELRTMRENQRHDLDREHQRTEQELATRERAHERELHTMRESQAQALKSTEQSYEARIDGLKGRISDLERQLTEAKAEVGELRARKEKGPLDAVEEVAKLKNALEVLSPGDQEPSSVWERIASGVIESVAAPMASAAAARMQTAPAAPPTPNPEEVAKRRAAAKAARAQAQAQSGPLVPTRKKPARQSAPITQADLSMAISFMEQAVLNGVDPAAFAESARTSVPKGIIYAIRDQGVDNFLDAIQLSDGSPLVTQNGRNFMRKTARYLLGYADEAPPPTEELPQPVEEAPTS